MLRLIALALLLFSSALFAQGLPAGVTPQMVQQVQSMSPAQQQALAKQYGIDLPGQSGDAIISDLNGIGEQGEAIEQQETPDSDERDSENNTAKFRVLKAARYGQDLFNRQVSTFAPTDDAPVPETYRLGIGDQLIVQLFGKENEQYTLQVGRNGDVNFPKLGSINLMGLTFEDARALIKTRVAQQLIGVEAVVSMGRLRAIGIFMAGEVRVPGAYSVSALTTVTQALFQAGGVTSIGTLRNIEVRRGGNVVSVFDTYDLLMRGNSANDIRLQSGDVVFVPPYQGIVEVSGEVKRPRVYEINGAETIQDVLSMAGDYTTRAYTGLAVLLRKPVGDALPTAISLNLTEPATLARKVQDGDVLKVSATGDSLVNTVALQGAVYRDGSFGWYPGMRVSDLIRDPQTDLLPEADLNFALIVRTKNEVLDIELIQFRLIEALSAPKTETDPILNKYDALLVFSLPDLEGAGATGANTRAKLLAPILDKLRAQAREDEPVQTVSISGAVKAPGVYPLFEGTTVASLVRAAGGLLDAAFLESAELRQLREQRSGDMSASYLEIDLNRALAGIDDYPMSSRDHLNVRQIPDWNPQESVEIGGEVEFPGTYFIQKNETIADVVKRAGGLTAEAFADGAIFTRVAIARKEVERARAYAQEIRKNYASRMLTQEAGSQVDNLGEITAVTAELDKFEGKGRLLIDLSLALTGNNVANLLVEDGDKLFIPKYNPSVTVVGEVMESRSHSYNDNYGVRDYIGLSAGLTVRADDSAIYVVKANGSVAMLDKSWWRFDSSNLSIAPGDTIVVPINNQYQESLATVRDVTQILYQGLVAIAVVVAL